ncbi:demethylmenaquinone methyltransferase [Boudabousia marimammalium]|uniref:Demethylmenaquinone methyltransferase n=1 Tax=Boudabousia marimammalium TaxID=156892 RepID=A0A1Q5PME2_9ACTO|nr:demethylmenaquinone methyltransferase [Boudabousia marimammalium]OKL48714.1 bifunctional demethylmenaquinone methyltransferase/2-methoxy-6-polyprenyl-1,4-benzoquinol methylase [Boudabousia marimammalium]
MTDYAADKPVDKSPHRVAEMFDSVAAHYDITNDVMSLGMDRAWRHATYQALQPEAGQLILDLAAGTGTSSAALAKSGATVIACDISLGMMEQGKKLHPEIQFVAGNATALPFADDTFDAVTISFGLRNVDDTMKALQEMRRVTKPGGRIVICEFSEPTWKPFRKLYHFYMGTLMQKMSSLLQSNDSAYVYLANSIMQWPNQEKLGALLVEAGWKAVEYRNLTGGIAALHRATV